MNNFAVLCKGKSLEKLDLISDKFTDCYIVNNWENELIRLSNLLKGKNITQFVNRRGTIRMPKKIYDEFEIKNIQYNLPLYMENIPPNGYKTRRFGISQYPKLLTKEADKKTRKRWKEYVEDFGLNLLWLPDSILFWNEDFKSIENFPTEYKWKHPNTGVQACIMAAEVLKPDNLWIIGLDFYQSDYLHRRECSLPLETQQVKMKRTKMFEHFGKVLDYYNDTKWHIVTAYPEFKPRKHVEIMLYDDKKRS